MPTLQKNTLLKNAQANAESNFFKRVFFSPTQKEIQIIFFPTLRFFNYLFSQRTVRNRTGIALNVNRLEQSVCKLDMTHLRTDRRASGNKGLPKAGVTSFYDSFVLNQTLVFQINGCAETPTFGKPRNVSGNKLGFTLAC